MRILQTHKTPTRRNKDIAIFVLFLILASLLWYGHAMQSVRNTQVPVYVHYTGKPGTIGLGEEGLPDQVLIEVRDAGHRLNAYHQSPLQITIDLRQYIHGDTGTIHIPANDLRSSIKAVLQDNSNLINTVPEEISCSYFTEKEKTVVVQLNGDMQVADGYQMVGNPRFQKELHLYGKKSRLKTIDTIYTQPFSLRDMSDTTHVVLALDIPKGVRAEKDSLEVEIITEQYTEKRFMVEIKAEKVPEGCYLHLFPNKAEVNVRIGVSHYSEIRESDFKVTCDYPRLPISKLKLDLKYPDNPHITSAWVYPSEVEYFSEQ